LTPVTSNGSVNVAVAEESFRNCGRIGIAVAILDTELWPAPACGRVALGGLTTALSAIITGETISVGTVTWICWTGGGLLKLKIAGS
jgi:hypothetical protein